MADKKQHDLSVSNYGTIRQLTYGIIILRWLIFMKQVKVFPVIGNPGCFVKVLLGSLVTGKK